VATNEESTERSTSIIFRNLFRMNTCRSLSKQATLTIFRMNTYEKLQGEGTKKGNSKLTNSNRRVKRKRVETYSRVAGLRSVCSIDCATWSASRLAGFHAAIMFRRES
jgi:hypothetical protein